MAQVYLGLGSNLDNPQQQLLQAIASLRMTPGLTLGKVSSFYHSEPWGDVTDQPGFVNAVAQLSVELEPLQLLGELQLIEKKQNRVRDRQRWGPRTIDLDILLFDQIRIKSPQLSIPHLYLKQREFVVYPLYEIAPQLVFPDGESLHSVMLRTPQNGLKKLEVV